MDRVAQPGAQRAYLWLRNAIEGQRIWLQFDDERIDSYQRQLVYVFNTQGEHINQQLLLNGLVTLSLHPPNLRYQFELSQAQDTARRQGRGIWGDPEYAPMPMSSLNRGSIGQWGRFYGVVNRIEQLKTGVRLWFNAKTYVWIPFRFLSYFGTLDDYRDHKLEVMAWPGKRGEKYSLLVRHPSQLKCLAGRCLEFE